MRRRRGATTTTAARRDDDYSSPAPAICERRDDDYALRLRGDARFNMARDPHGAFCI
jgi:hypothetical protein